MQTTYSLWSEATSRNGSFWSSIFRSLYLVYITRSITLLERNWELYKHCLKVYQILVQPYKVSCHEKNHYIIFRSKLSNYESTTQCSLSIHLLIYVSTAYFKLQSITTYFRSTMVVWTKQNGLFVSYVNFLFSLNYLHTLKRRSDIWSSYNSNLSPVVSRNSFALIDIPVDPPYGVHV
jgi:hypothetical protein